MFKASKTKDPDDTSQSVPCDKSHKIFNFSCFYCPKVFDGANVLLKHVLKRHSEMLVNLYKTIVDKTSQGSDALPEEDILKYLKAEVSNLRHELEVVKNTVDNYAENYHNVIVPKNLQQNVISMHNTDVSKLNSYNVEDDVDTIQFNELSSQVCENDSLTVIEKCQVNSPYVNQELKINIIEEFKNMQQQINMSNTELTKSKNEAYIQIEQKMTENFQNLMIAHQKATEEQTEEIKRKAVQSEERILKWIKQSLINELKSMMLCLQKRVDASKEEIKNELLVNEQKNIIQLQQSIMNELQNKIINHQKIIYAFQEEVKTKFLATESKNFKQLKHILLKDFQENIETVQKRIDVTREDIMKKIENNENKIVKHIYQTLINEFQNMMGSQEKKLTADYKMYLTDIKKELKRLDETVDRYSHKIESTDYLLEIEKKLENQLQNIFISKPKCHVKKKISKSPVNNDAFSSRARLRRKKKSVFTLTSQDSSKTDSVYKQLDISRKKESIKSPNSLGDSNIKTTNNTTKIYLSKGDRASKPVCNTKNIPINELNYLINEKLSSLNINPKIEKVSSEEYEKKLSLINSEKDYLGCKYKNFHQVRTDLELRVDEILKAKMQQKPVKKLRFFDSDTKLLSKKRPENNPSLLSYKENEKNILKNCDSSITLSVQNTSDFNSEGDNCLAISNSNIPEEYLPELGRKKCSHSSNLSAMHFDQSVIIKSRNNLSKVVVHSKDQILQFSSDEHIYTDEINEDFKKSKNEMTNITTENSESLIVNTNNKLLNIDTSSEYLAELSDMSSLSEIEEKM